MGEETAFGISIPLFIVSCIANIILPRARGTKKDIDAASGVLGKHRGDAPAVNLLGRISVALEDVAQNVETSVSLGDAKRGVNSRACSDPVQGEVEGENALSVQGLAFWCFGSLHTSCLLHYAFLYDSWVDTCIILGIPSVIFAISASFLLVQILDRLVFPHKKHETTTRHPQRRHAHTAILRFLSASRWFPPQTRSDLRTMEGFLVWLVKLVVWTTLWSLYLLALALASPFLFLPSSGALATASSSTGKWVAIVLIVVVAAPPLAVVLIGGGTLVMVPLFATRLCAHPFFFPSRCSQIRNITRTTEAISSVVFLATSIGKKNEGYAYTLAFVFCLYSIARCVYNFAAETLRVVEDMAFTDMTRCPNLQHGNLTVDTDGHDAGVMERPQDAVAHRVRKADTGFEWNDCSSERSEEPNGHGPPSYTDERDPSGSYGPGNEGVQPWYGRARGSVSVDWRGTKYTQGDTTAEPSFSTYADDRYDQDDAAEDQRDGRNGSSAHPVLEKRYDTHDGTSTDSGVVHVGGPMVSDAEAAPCRLRSDNVVTVERAEHLKHRAPPHGWHNDASSRDLGYHNDDRVSFQDDVSIDGRGWREHHENAVYDPPRRENSHLRVHYADEPASAPHDHSGEQSVRALSYDKEFGEGDSASHDAHVSGKKKRAYDEGGPSSSPEHFDEGGPSSFRERYDEGGPSSSRERYDQGGPSSFREHFDEGGPSSSRERGTTHVSWKETRAHDDGGPSSFCEHGTQHVSPRGMPRDYDVEDGSLCLSRHPYAEDVSAVSEDHRIAYHHAYDGDPHYAYLVAGDDDAPYAHEGDDDTEDAVRERDDGSNTIFRTRDGECGSVSQRKLPTYGERSMDAYDDYHAQRDDSRIDMPDSWKEMQFCDSVRSLDDSSACIDLPISWMSQTSLAKVREATTKNLDEMMRSLQESFSRPSKEEFATVLTHAECNNIVWRFDTSGAVIADFIELINGLKVGDHLLRIEGVDLSSMNKQEIQDLWKRSFRRTRKKMSLNFCR